jgi:hypothetical protein
VGTSSSYKGPGGSTPLIPTWLNEPSGGGEVPPAEPPASPEPQGVPTTPTPQPELPQPKRYSTARNNFTRFAQSGGSDRRSLGRAISGYVSGAAGGSRQAAQRMGSSRASASRLTNFLSSVQSGGIRQALRELSLESLAGRPIDEIFIGLADYVCPDGGTVDEGIARDAFIETIADLASAGITDMDALTTDQMQTVLELYITHTIEARICNDSGTKSVNLPSNPDSVREVQGQLQNFILRAVSDALTAARAESPTLSTVQINSFVDNVYGMSFEILQTLGEAEADK